MAEFGEPLSERELDVLEQLMQGAANKEIAEILSISPNTVKVHLRNIYTKLGVSSRTEASMVALEQRLFAPADIFDSVPSENGRTDPPTAETPPATLEEAAAEPPEPAPEPVTPVQSTPLVSGRTWLLASGLIGFVAILGILLFYYPQILPTTITAEPTAEPFTPIEIEPSWFRTRNMPTPRTEMAAISVGTNVYQIGGRINGEVSDRVDIFDTRNSTWRTAADKPTAVANITAAELLEIYVPGGLTAAGTPTDIVEAYSPATNSWRVVQPLPKPLAGALTLSNESGIYLFGGWDGEHYLPDAYIYDPAVDAWSQLPDMTHPRAGAAGGIISGRLYVVGGFDGSQYLNLCEFYDPQTNSWTNCKPSEQPRGYAGATVVLNKLYILGGQPTGELDGELYNPAEETWEQIDIPTLPADQAVGWQNLAVTNVEARIFIQGGTISETAASDQVLIYTPPVYQTYIPATAGGGE